MIMKESKNFKLRQTEIGPGGYAAYERVEPNAVDEFIEGAKKVTRYIAQEGSDRTEGVREAIKATALTDDQRIALGNALAAALAVATPNAAETAFDTTTTETVSKSSQNGRGYVERISLPTVDSFLSKEAHVHYEDSGRFQNELRERIDWWNTNMQEYFVSSLELADKPVVGADSMSREEYIRSQVVFEEHPTWGSLPEATQDEIRRLLPALAVQESGYHNGLVSKNGAVGILQQIPDAITHLSDYSVQEVQRSLKKQVEIAGRYFINARYVMFDSERFGIGESAKSELLSRHSQESFERDFLPLVLVNGYNVGPAGMAREIREYFEVPEHKENDLTGAELYYDIINWSRETKEVRGSSFGDDARNYVVKIAAAAEILENPELRGRVG